MDATIASLVIARCSLYEEIPIYTVHDCFLTSAVYAGKMPSYYIESILKLNYPLSILDKPSTLLTIILYDTAQNYQD